MARQARLIVPGQAHLVLQRGHRRTPLFYGPASAATYLQQLAELSLQRAVRVHAFGLDPHEVRLLLTPESSSALSALMQALATRHARTLNRMDGAAGSPWLGRFGCAVVDAPSSGLDAMLFVEGAAEGPDRALASSAGHHAGAERLPWLVDHPFYWALGNTPFEREAVYRHRHDAGVAPELARNLRARASNGWAIGAPAFLDEMSRLTERQVVPARRGRPRKIPVPE